MTADDRDQQNELLANGTLCYSCGNLIESLVGEDKILKTSSGKPTLCKSCHVDINKTSPKRMDSGYGVELTPDTDSIKIDFRSPLEQGFIPVEEVDEQ